MDMKIFVDTDSDIRLVRQLRRDITERGRDIETITHNYVLKLSQTAHMDLLVTVLEMS